MAGRLTRLFLVLFAVSQLAATCKGTETGNPGSSPGDNGTGTGNPETYTNGNFGVTAEYDSGWTFSEADGSTATNSPSGNPGGPSPSVQQGIDTSGALFTTFTDGTSTVTLFYVTLSRQPASLEAFLAETFPGRSFVRFSNSHMAGYTYDNPESGAAGGDRREYYFLNGTTLLYVVTDLFETNDAVGKFGTFVDSLSF